MGLRAGEICGVKQGALVFKRWIGPEVRSARASPSSAAHSLPGMLSHVLG